MAPRFAFPLVIQIQTIGLKMLKKIRALPYECSCSSVDGAYSGVEKPGVNFLAWLCACSSQNRPYTAVFQTGAE